MNQIVLLLSKASKAAILLFIFAILFTNITHAKETIFWPYFNYPPLFIIEGDAVSGYGIDILNLLREKLVEYDHKLIPASPKRMFENMKFEKSYCAVGPAKTKERREYLHYSLPIRVTFPDMVIMRKQSTIEMGIAGKVLLKDLLLNEDLTLGHIRSASSDPLVDRIIKNHGVETRMQILSGANAMQHLVQMLYSKRVDWFIWDPASIRFYEKSLGGAEELTALSIKELTIPAALGYITCPKNDWGKHIIERIDKILVKEIPTERYFSFFSPWIHVDQMESYRSIFKDYLVAAVNKTQ